MPLVTRSTTYDMHGASFESFVSPRTGSRDLCAWRTTLCPGQSGTEHTVDSEEVMLVLSGAPRLALDGCKSTPSRARWSSCLREALCYWTIQETQSPKCG